MSEYVGLALCSVRCCKTKQLFQIPAFCSSIEVGDSVIVEGYEDLEVSVNLTTSVIYGSSEYEMILALARASTSKPLKKVLKKIQYKELDYKNEIVLEGEDNE